MKRNRFQKLWCEVTCFLKELGIKFVGFVVIFLIIICLGLLALDSFGLSILILLLSDIGIDYWLENVKIIRSIKLKKSGSDFDEARFDLYWQINKMRLSLMLRITLFCFSAVKYISELNLPTYSNSLLPVFSEIHLICIRLLVIFITFIVGIIASSIFILETQQEITQIVEDLYKESEHNFIKNPNNKKENTNEKTI